VRNKGCSEKFNDGDEYTVNKTCSDIHSERTKLHGQFLPVYPANQLFLYRLLVARLIPCTPKTSECTLDPSQKIYPISSAPGDESKKPALLLPRQRLLYQLECRKIVLELRDAFFKHQRVSEAAAESWHGVTLKFEKGSPPATFTFFPAFYIFK
jgi:hypothetical protein